MRDEDLLAALRRLKVQTGSLACLGCGYEHECGVHGCMILRETVAWLERKLAEDKDGRVVVLPCKMGDTVWVILDGAKCVRRCVVEYATIGRYFTVIVFHTAGRTREQYGVPAGAFGKTVFLTSEEAEKALEAMKDG